MCCRLKMKLEELWQRTSGCILKIRGVTPDGAGNFELEAGQNVNISEVSNGLRISTTGGVSYYTSDDPQLDIDNDDLKISLVDVAKDSDLDVVAQNVTNVINGTTQVRNATNSVNAQYLGSSTNNVGNDKRPIKIVNGQAVAVIRDYLQYPLYTSASSTSGEDYYPTIWSVKDNNGRDVIQFKLHYSANGTVAFYLRCRNGDDSWRDVSLE